MAGKADEIGEIAGRAFKDVGHTLKPIVELPTGLMRKQRRNQDDVEENDSADGLFDGGQPIRSGSDARGLTDGGPGHWAESPRRTKGQDYQEFITGVERGTEYRVDGVNFDRYDGTRGVLLDAKDWRDFPPVDRDFWHKGTLNEIDNQVTAADGTPTEWHFSTQSAKSEVDRLLQRNDMVGDITTVFTPVG